MDNLIVNVPECDRKNGCTSSTSTSWSSNPVILKVVDQFSDLLFVIFEERRIDELFEHFDDVSSWNESEGCKMTNSKRKFRISCVAICESRNLLNSILNIIGLLRSNGYDTTIWTVNTFFDIINVRYY